MGVVLGVRGGKEQIITEKTPAKRSLNSGSHKNSIFFFFFGSLLPLFFFFKKMDGHTRSPTNFLNSVIGQNVVVKLNSGIDYKGTQHQQDKGFVLLLTLFFLQACWLAWMDI